MHSSTGTIGTASVCRAHMLHNARRSTCSGTERPPHPLRQGAPHALALSAHHTHRCWTHKRRPKREKGLPCCTTLRPYHLAKPGPPLTPLSHARRPYTCPQHAQSRPYIANRPPVSADSAAPRSPENSRSSSTRNPASGVQPSRPVSSANTSARRAACAAVAPSARSANSASTWSCARAHTQTRACYEVSHCVRMS